MDGLLCSQLAYMHSTPLLLPKERLLGYISDVAIYLSVIALLNEGPTDDTMLRGPQIYIRTFLLEFETL